jgi:nucleoside 2-deoxyribosyltransferase
VYVSSPCGFSEPLFGWYLRVLLPALKDAGLQPFDPWHIQGIFTEEMLSDAEQLPDEKEAEDMSVALCATIGRRNCEFIENCCSVLAVLDGVDVDAGVAAEIGYAAACGKPIVGLRTDRRTATDSHGSPINLQVMYFISLRGGKYVTSVEDACSALKSLTPVHG